MKNETARTMIFMTVCAVGGVLIGLNAAHLSNGRNAALFVIGVVLVSSSTMIVGFLQTVWKRRKKK